VEVAVSSEAVTLELLNHFLH